MLRCAQHDTPRERAKGREGRKLRAGTHMMDVVVFACDVGSTRRGNFGWARVVQESGGFSVKKGKWIDGCVQAMLGDVREGRSLALGMECPLFIPVPNESKDLSRGRKGEGNRSCFAPVGGYVATLGLHQLAFILKKMLGCEMALVLEAERWVNERKSVLLWEAFVSGKVHSKDHCRDAATAATAFMRKFLSGKLSTDVPTEEPGEVLSLVGCALLWAGWPGQVDFLRKPVLVVRPSQKYQGRLETYRGSGAFV